MKGEGHATEGAQPVDPSAGGDELVGDAARVEEFEGAGVDGEGPGQIGGGLGAPLDEGDGETCGGEVAA